MKPLLNVISLSILTFSSMAFAGNKSYLTYQGRIIKPDGSPVSGASVSMTVQIVAPTGCLLWEQSVGPVDFSTSKGAFTVTVGNGVNTAAGALTWDQIFQNGVALGGGALSGCGGTYTGAATDDRTLYMVFNDGSGNQTVGPVAIKATANNSMFAGFPFNGVPTNGQTMAFDDTNDYWYPYTPAGGGSLNSVAFSAPAMFSIAGSPVTGAGGTITMSLANQTANTIFAGPSSGGPAAPTFRALVAADLTPALPAQATHAGKFLQTDGAGNLSWQTSGGAGDITDVVAGTALTGGAASGSATLNVDVGLGASKIPQVGGSAISANSIILSNGTGNLTHQTLTNGQILIGSTGFAPVAATLTGTANQVNIANGSGSITLSTPQDIHSGASPTFNALTLSTALPITSGGTGQTTATAAMNALDPLTTKGDLLVHNGTDSIRLPVGTDTWVLTADSAQASGVKWAAAASGADNLGNHTATTNVQLNNNWLSNDGGNEGIRIDNSGNVGVGTTAPTTGTRLDITGTGAAASSIIIPRDTVANRPTVGVNGMLRYATDTNKFEAYENGAWTNMIGGGGLTGVTGPTETFLGVNAGISNTSGQHNVALGEGALNSNTTGYENVAVGRRSLNTQTTGYLNSALGYRSLYSNSTGYANTAIGRFALYGNTIGYDNTAIGVNALQNLVGNSHDNIAIGYGAGAVLTSGNYNVILGSNDGSTLVGNNNILIADGQGVERIRILNTGNVGIGTAAPSDLLHIKKDQASTTRMVVDNANTGGASQVQLKSDTAVGAFYTLGSTSTPSGSDQPNGTVLAGNGNGGLSISAPNPSGVIRFYTLNATSERMRIDASGNVGVGTTSPNTALDVSGAFSMREMAAPAVSPADQGRIYFDSTANKFKVSEHGGAYTDLVGGGAADHLGNHTATTNIQLGANYLSGDGGSEGIQVDSVGKASITTADTTAAKLLTLTTTGVGGRPSIVFQRSGPTEIGSVGFRTASSDNMSVWNGANSDLLFGTNNTERMRIDSFGNVGIGTAAPTTGTRLDITGTGIAASSIIIPRDTVANRPTVGVNGMMRYASDTNKFEAYENGAWKNMISAAGGGALSAITAATATNSIMNGNYAQTWNWHLANTQNPMTMMANGLTTGSILSVTTSSASLNSTSGVLNVANTSAATTGILARFQANSTAGSGLTVLANGSVGIGTATPSSSVALDLVKTGGTITGVNSTVNASGAGAQNAIYGTANGTVGSIATGGYFSATGGSSNQAVYGNASGGTFNYGGSFSAAGFSSFGVSATTSGGGSPARAGYFASDDATNNAHSDVVQIAHSTSGVAANGIGASILFSMENISGGLSDGASVRAIATDATAATFTSALAFYTTTGGGALTERMRIAGDGNVGIGTTSPSARLDVEDTGTTTSAIIVPRAGNFTGVNVNGMVRYNTTSNLFEFRQNGVWVNYTTVSDGRLKTNVVPVQQGLEIVNQLNPVFFDWDQSSPRTKSFGTQHQVGFIAQEVEKVLPEVVNKGEDSYRSVEYGKIIAVVVAAVKELYGHILGLDRSVASVTTQLEQLKIENEKLKSDSLATKEENKRIRIWICSKEPSSDICR